MHARTKLKDLTFAANDDQQSIIHQSMSFLPKMRGFKMALLNVGSLKKHIDEVRILLSDNSIDVLAINETRLDSTISDNEMHIRGYELVRRDRNINGRLGGGVCFYVGRNINYSSNQDLSLFSL